MRGAYGAMPAAEASHAGGGAGWGAPPPDVAGVAAAPEAMPFDMLSFPAGLIPKLVKHSLKCGTCQPRPLVATIESQCCTILHWTTSSCCWPHLQCKMTQPSHSVASMHSICNACAQCEIEIFLLQVREGVYTFAARGHREGATAAAAAARRLPAVPPQPFLRRGCAIPTWR